MDPLPGIILGMDAANERRRYNVTSSLIGWAHAQNDPGWLIVLSYAEIPSFSSNQPSDAMWRRRIVSTLDQVIYFILTAPSIAWFTMLICVYREMLKNTLSMVISLS